MLNVTVSSGNFFGNPSNPSPNHLKLDGWLGSILTVDICFVPCFYIVHSFAV